MAAASLGPGFVIGITIALCGEMFLALTAALWLRRPRPVAVGALLGAATSDAILGSLGAVVGGWIAAVVQDPGLRSTIAVGLLMGVAARLILGRLIGAYGVPGNAELPTRPIATWARFTAIGLFGPIPALIVGASVVARPVLAADGAIVGLVAGAVAGALVIRFLWAPAGERRRGVRSARSMTTGLTLVAILMLAALAIRLGS